MDTPTTPRNRPLTTLMIILSLTTPIMLTTQGCDNHHLPPAHTHDDQPDTTHNPDSGSPDQDHTQNITAVATALPHLINEGEDTITVITLDGSQSQGPADQTLTYNWEAPGCTIIEGTLQTPTVRCAFTGQEPKEVHLTVTTTKSNPEQPQGDTHTLHLPLNQKPRVELTGPETINRNTPATIKATIHDPEDTPTENHFTLSPGFPPGTTLNTTGDTEAQVTCPEPGPVTIIATATDTMGATGTASITIEVQNQPPILGFIGNRTVRAGTRLTFTTTATDPDGDPITFSAHNLPPDAIYQEGTFTWDTTPDHIGTHPVTFSAQDGIHTTEEEVIITVLTIPGEPVLTLAPPDLYHQIGAGQELTIMAGAWTSTGTEGTLEAAPLPPGANFNPETGEFNWTPAPEHTGTHEVNFKVTTAMKTAQQTVTIMVTPEENRAPILTIIPDQTTWTMAEGETMELHVEATDPDGDQITLGSTDLPPNATFTTQGTTGHLVFTPSHTQAGVHQMTITATDGHLLTRTTITVAVSDVNRPPQLTVTPGQEVVGLTGQTVILKITAQDPDGDTVHLQMDQSPLGAGLDLTTGVFTWTPGAHQTGSHTVVFRAVDEGIPPQSTTLEATINVRQSNRAPVLTKPIGPREVHTGATLTIDLHQHFTDPDKDPLTFSLPAKPGWVTMAPGSGTIAISPKDPTLAMGTWPVTARASDGRESADTTFQVTVILSPAGTYTFSQIATPGFTASDGSTGAWPMGSIHDLVLGTNGDELYFASHHQGERLAIHRMHNQGTGTGNNNAQLGPPRKVIERYDRNEFREAFRSFGSFLPVAPGKLAFVGHTWGYSGVFIIDLEETPVEPPRVLVRQTWDAPGGMRIGTVGMDAITPDLNFGWCGTPFGLPEQRAALVYSGGKLRTAAAQGSPAPGGGTFTTCAGPVITGRGGHVAFRANLSGGHRGLFVWKPGSDLGPGMGHGQWKVAWRSDDHYNFTPLTSVDDFMVLEDGTLVFEGVDTTGNRGIFVTPFAGHAPPRPLVIEGTRAQGINKTVSRANLFCPQSIRNPDGAHVSHRIMATLGLEDQESGDPPRGIYTIHIDTGEMTRLTGAGDRMDGGLQLAGAYPLAITEGSGKGLVFQFQSSPEGYPGVGIRLAQPGSTLFNLRGTGKSGGTSTNIIISLMGDPLPDGSRFTTPVLVTGNDQGTLYFQQTAGGSVFRGAIQ